MTKRRKVTEARVEDMLFRVFSWLGLTNRYGVDDVRTFNDAGLLTYDKGVVVKYVDGTEMQITIRRSR